MNKVLLAVTTYNQLEYTQIFYESFKQLDSNLCDLVIFDDCSTDDTVAWCEDNNIKVITKQKGKGLTDSWNSAYKYFNQHGYEYFIIANNDILIPKGAIEELCTTLERWPGSMVAPLTTELGCGHNKVQNIDLYYGKQSIYNDHKYYQQVQDSILNLKKKLASNEGSNSLYRLDPIRMKLFNGFFFMMSKKICQYEREDKNLFNPEYINVKNEDMFNWDNLISNDDNVFLCMTSFIFHFKGVSFTKAGISYSNNLEEHLKQRENKLNTTR